MAWTHNDAHPLAEEAAQWLIELEEPNPRTLQAFAAWLETSPRHVEEFLLASSVWKEFDDLDAQRRIQIDQLVSQAKMNVLQLSQQAVHDSTEAKSDRTRRRALAFLSAAAAVVLSAVAVWLFGVVTAPDVYATSRGEQRSFKLEDGSVIYLNTQSRVEVQFSRNARDIRLLEGEAMFSVEHDAERPFRVMSNGTVIRAIGTHFNVYRSTAGTTTVSVVEGIVEISPATLSAPQTQAAPLTTAAKRVAAGEQARVSHAGEIVKEVIPDLEHVVAWRERRLVFRGDSLDYVAREFNRYNVLQIRLQGEAVQDKRLTGVFDADDPRSLLQFLQRDDALAVDELTAQEVLIRER